MKKTSSVRSSQKRTEITINPGTAEVHRSRSSANNKFIAYAHRTVEQMRAKGVAEVSANFSGWRRYVAQAGGTKKTYAEQEAQAHSWIVQTVDKLYFQNSQCPAALAFWEACLIWDITERPRQNKPVSASLGIDYSIHYFELPATSLSLSCNKGAAPSLSPVEPTIGVDDLGDGDREEGEVWGDDNEEGEIVDG